MLQWFIRFPEFAWIHWISGPFRQNPIVMSLKKKHHTFIYSLIRLLFYRENASKKSSFIRSSALNVVSSVSLLIKCLKAVEVSDHMDCSNRQPVQRNTSVRVTTANMANFFSYKRKEFLLFIPCLARASFTFLKHRILFLNGAEFSLNLANLGNLINHWSMNWGKFNDPVSHTYLAGAVEASWSVTQKVAGSSPFNDIYLCQWICWMWWKHLGKTLFCCQL